MATLAPKETFVDLIPKHALRRGLGIQTRLLLLQVLVFSLLTLILGAVQVHVLRQSIQHEYGQRALAISRTVAQIPSIIEAFDDSDPSRTINPLANRIRAQVGADYIVVGDVNEIRLSHPLPDRLGKPMVGGDNAEPLAGKEIVSVATGSLGAAIRGKVPVWREGRVIGVVSTGYLLPTVQSITAQVSQNLLPWFGLALLFALASSALVSRRIKRDILNLEPEQIAALVQQHRAVLGALHEGVMVVSRTGQIQLLNPKAVELLRLDSGLSLPVGLDAVWPELGQSGLLGGPNLENAPFQLGGLPVLVSLFRMTDGQYLATFRDRAEIVQMAEELTQTRRYADLLRAQTHEFMNRLHTIAGLIQLGKPEEALGVIGSEAQASKALREFIADIAVPKLAALIIGKYERARELGIDFTLEPGSAIRPVWAEHSEALERALGNLLENALEAVQHNPKSRPKQVRLLIGEDPEGLQLEVSDNGAGVPAALAEKVFERGFSTKGDHRGLGLSLARQQVEGLGGTLRHFRRGAHTVFQISLPSLETP
ncbi:MAG: sensor histidine kinase [Meiothermus sp.]|nr:sensor histidine kinase [Meiothermus sp.]